VVGGEDERLHVGAGAVEERDGVLDREIVAGQRAIDRAGGGERERPEKVF
jgi:hypothetical protein